MDSQQLEKLLEEWSVEEPPPHVRPMVRATVERVRRLEAEKATLAEPPAPIVERKWHVPGRPHWPIATLATALIAASLILLIVGSAIVLFLHRGNAIEPTPPLRAAAPVVSDVSIGDPTLPAVERVSSAGVMHIYDDGAFRPNAPVLRVEMAAISVRTSGLALLPGTPVTATIADGELQQSYNTLIERGLVSGSYGPAEKVLQIQMVSFLSRTMVAAGQWKAVQADDPAIYPNVQVGPRDRLDLMTYVRNAGPLPGLPTTQDWTGFDQLAHRGWVAQVVAQALPRAGFAPLPARAAMMIDGGLMIAELRSLARGC